MMRAEMTSVSPGDDALTFRLVPYRRALQIGVFGKTASAFKLVLSTTDTVVPLSAGEGKRFFSQAGGYRYFSATVPRGHAVDIMVTPLTGDPDLFVSASVERPDFDKALVRTLTRFVVRRAPVAPLRLASRLALHRHRLRIMRARSGESTIGCSHCAGC